MSKESKYKRDFLAAVNNDLIIAPIVDDSFNKADSDKKGYITKEELKKCMIEISLGLGVPGPCQKDVDAEFANLDINEDKHISKKEFSKIIKKTLIKLAEEL
ncbi:MAG: EF-hand domain-containing protein [archaeon]|nr:EF-hand domain-containing protein [archaeon]